MTPQELKASILQLAIQGKLVEQRAEEGTAEELYQQIQKEKQRLIKDGVVKKEKPLPPICEDSVPFDIPDTWQWIRMADVGQLKNGYAFKSAEYVTEGIQVVRISDLEEDKISTKDAVYYTAQTDLTPYLLENDSFLICLTGSIGKMAWVRDSVPRYLNQRVGMFVPYGICNNSYIWYYLHTNHVIDGWIRAKTSTNGNIKSSDITELMLPLPPLAEQKRIVAKIEELLPYIDRYEQAWSRLEDFNRRFPVDMQKSILQMAIQGKLVEQRPEEGTGEALFKLLKPYHAALKPCKDELDFSSMDFDLPENWVMAELNQLFDFVDYRGKTPTKITEGIFLVTASNIRQGYMDYTRKEYISPEEYETRKSRGLTERGDLLFTTEAPMGNAALCELDECSCGQRIITFKAYREHTVFPKLFMYFILSPQFQQQLLDNCTGTTAKGIKADKLKHFLIPLPPLAEQKRIVAKLEEILPLCDRLK